MVTNVSDTVVETMAEGQFKYRPEDSSGLNFFITGGRLTEIVEDGGPQEYPDTTFVLTDNSTNYVFLNFANTPATLEASTVKPGSDIMLIWKVQTASGAVFTAEDFRWKTVNNRFLQDPFWPSNEPMTTLYLAGQSSNRNGIHVLKGEPGTDTFRYQLVVERDGTERITLGDGTSTNWGYGFWKDLRTDGKYFIANDNVNGSSNFPFRAFKRKTGQRGIEGLQWDWIDQVNIDDLIDDASAPESAQRHYLEYNPVYNEIVVSGNTGWWVYDDNDDDTFTVNRPIDSFDTQPSGAGQRQYRASLFTPDGEWFISAFVGGNSLQFYTRETTGARYQLSQEITDTYDAAGIWWDESRNQLVLKGQASGEPLRYMIRGYELNAGTWSEVWEEDDTTNPDFVYNALSPEHTLGSNVDNFMIASDGSFMHMSAVTSGGSYGHFIFIPRVGGGWQHTTNTLPNSVPTSRGGELFEVDHGGETYYLWTGSNDATDDGKLYRHEGNGVFTFLEDITIDTSKGRGHEIDSAGMFPCVPLYNGTVVDPTESILLPYDPYFAWWPTVEFDGPEQKEYRAGYYYGLPNRESGNLEQHITIWQDDSTPPTEVTFVDGPITNTRAMEITGSSVDLEDPGGLDFPNYITSTINEPNGQGDYGTLVFVVKTASALPVSSDSNSLVRPLFQFGQSGGFSQPHIIPGMAVTNAGANLRFRCRIGRDGGSNEFANVEASNDLALDTWYVLAVRQRTNGQPFELLVNGVLQDVETLISIDPSLSAHNYWMSRITSTKQTRIFDGSLGNVITGTQLHAMAYYNQQLLSDVTLQRIASDYGL